jgi:hypothetical protein
MRFMNSGLRAAMALLPVLFAAGCGPKDTTDAQASAAPVRQMEAFIKAPPKNGICVGFRSEAGKPVEDFPAGVLDSEYGKFNWMKRASTCPDPVAHKPDPTQYGYMTCSVTARDASNVPTNVTCVLLGMRDSTVEYEVGKDTSGIFAIHGARIVSPSGS